MEKIIIHGRKALQGDVHISGAKNAAVAVLPASLLIEGSCRIENLPDIKDTQVLEDTLTQLGAKVTFENRNTVLIDSSNVNSYTASYDMIKSMRASYYLLGALLGRFGKAEVAFPGGCDFGYRPMDQHIKGFEAMGAKVVIENGMIKLSADKLTGSQIYLDVVSVGATINLMLAAVKAEGTTIIENAAKEPHIVDTANFLNAAGADIKGAGTDVIKIKGVPHLRGGHVHSIIPDMIEAGTFMIAGAATDGDVTVRNVIPKHLESLSAKLQEMNINVIKGEDWIRVIGGNEIQKANIKTLPYPGFATDLHPPVTVLLCLANGSSTITESIWPLRFQYVNELVRMGAKIRVDGGGLAVIDGPVSLVGAQVNAIDLRAGAAVVVAGLAADGTTVVNNVKYIDRGYEDFVGKLRKLGADIARISE